MLILLAASLSATRVLGSYLSTHVDLGVPLSVFRLHQALSVASRVLWLFAIPGAFILLKYRGFPLVKKAVFRIIRLLAIEEIERRLFSIAAAVMVLGIVTTIAMSIMADNLLGISNIYADKGHYLRDGVAYVVNDAGHAMTVETWSYYAYYGMRLVFFEMHIPFIVSFLYLILRKYIPLAYDVVNLIDEEDSDLRKEGHE